MTYRDDEKAPRFPTGGLTQSMHNTTADDISHDSRISQLVQTLRAYLAPGRGWALVPLHDVSAGVCSCRAGLDCGRSAGKHPRTGAEWQRPENLVRDEAGLAVAVARWPSCNWGLATGMLSQCWALDYDERDVIDRAAADRVLALAWSTAAWVQRTGSGGLHFVFALPEDFVPSNVEGDLPKGFNVRGAKRGASTGGQIVIAPSWTLKGSYEVLRDLGVLQLAAPELTDMLRPRPRPRAENAGTFTLTADNRGQAAAYVVSGVRGSLQKLRETPVSRNFEAFKTACRVQELANTGLLGEGGHEAVHAAWWAAAAAHPDPAVTVPDRELLSVWASAERTVGDRPADLSGVGGPAGWMGGDGIRGPSPALAAVPLLGGGPGTGAGGAAAAQPVDNLWTAGVTPQDGAGQGRDSGQIDPVDALLAEMLDVDALRNIVPPQPLINGVLDLDTTAWLIGASGSYKSFVGLDLAAHVALGRPWRGHDVHQGGVVYIVAEGARGMKLRVDAWEREHGPMKGIRFLPRPVQVGDASAWDVLVQACRKLRPAFVIIDTQHRVTLGLEENSNTDMGRYIAAVDAIRTATGACVLTIHHTGRNGKDARGASALDGAQDAELKIEKTGQYALNLVMDKQKDQAQEPPISIRLMRSEGGTDPATGRDLSSLVVVHGEAPQLGEPVTAQDVGRRRALALFMAIYELLPNGGEGLQRAEIRALFMALPEIQALTANGRRKAWIRAWAFLLGRGRVMRYGNSQRFAVLPPLDGRADGMLAANGGTPEEAPPEGWQLMTVVADAELPEDE